ncbi:hypothetical protein ABGB14_37195 [Nonomuraea sp. B10E15]|uniref:hypothetical protein n=1 Tax=Nonomuraea sp. B10E15 TaxID=3153560 RepID=UPI00325F14BA
MAGAGAALAGGLMVTAQGPAAAQETSAVALSTAAQAGAATATATTARYPVRCSVFGNCTIYFPKSVTRTLNRLMQSYGRDAQGLIEAACGDLQSGQSICKWGAKHLPRSTFTHLQLAVKEGGCYVGRIYPAAATLGAGFRSDRVGPRHTLCR